MNEQELYKQIIMDHYKNPKNKVLECPEGYITKKGINPSCGDELELYVKIEGDIVSDIKFKGDGCSICCSSTSVMTQEVKGRDKEQVLNKIDSFSGLLKGEEFEEEEFEDAIAYIGISNFPTRFKCAFLSWQTLKDVLDKEING